jgi:hypothetical protein
MPVACAKRRLGLGAGAQLHCRLHDGLRLRDAGLFQHP